MSSEFISIRPVEPYTAMDAKLGRDQPPGRHQIWVKQSLISISPECVPVIPLEPTGTLYC